MITIASANREGSAQERYSLCGDFEERPIDVPPDFERLAYANEKTPKIIPRLTQSHRQLTPFLEDFLQVYLNVFAELYSF